MLKLVLVLLVAIGFATAHPPTRERIAHTAAPALEKLGPVGRFLLRPMHKVTAHNEVDFLINQVELARIMGREIPTETSFQNWIKARVKTSAGVRVTGKDPWGAPYYLSRSQTAITIGSNGPDGKRNTPDDIRLSKAI
jgi:hypothetical protein